MLRKLHQTLKKITEDFETRWHFNTCIASIMEMLNVLYTEEQNISAGAMAQILESLALMLAPFAPYLAQEIWEEIGKQGPVFRQAGRPSTRNWLKKTGPKSSCRSTARFARASPCPSAHPRRNSKALALADEKVEVLHRGQAGRESGQRTR